MSRSLIVLCIAATVTANAARREAVVAVVAVVATDDTRLKTDLHDFDKRAGTHRPASFLAFREDAHHTLSLALKAGGT